MPAQIDIPLVYNPSDEASLKRDLERFASGVYKYASDTALRFAPRYSVSKPNPEAAGYGTITRVAPATASSIVRVQLPRPNPQDGGKTIVIIRTVITGGVVLDAIGCLVDGRASIGLRADLGVTVVYFDGENFYLSPSGVVDWSGTAP